MKIKKRDRIRLSMDVSPKIKERIATFSAKNDQSLTTTINHAISALEILTDPNLDSLLYKDGTRTRPIFV